MKLSQENEATTPGPNKFFPQATRTGLSKGPAFSLKGAYRKKEGTKGGKLDIWDTFGLDTPVEHVSPGPAAYNPLSPSKIKKSSPAYSLTSRVGRADKEGDVRPTPGPGEYSPRLKFVRGHIPQFSFRCKHSDYELFVPDCVNEEFSF
ncbi:hypothetical protein HDV03_003282 [Kappamyces sp. JEL0829]|nr:hypothetical protein HDV03_003282 [Kappamyces sp. JEL0829]